MTSGLILVMELIEKVIGTLYLYNYGWTKNSECKILAASCNSDLLATLFTQNYPDFSANRTV